MPKRILFILLISFGYITSDAQNAPVWSVGTNAYYGGVLRYKPEMPKLKLTDLYGFELYAVKQTTGDKPWQARFNFPQVGYTFEYFNYGEPQELGEVYSLGTYLDFTANPAKKNQLRLNIGTGLVYSTKVYDAETNPDNKAISSKISYILRGTIHYEFKVSSNYYLNLNMAFRHYSNGKLNMPNNGMNFPAVGVGVRYTPQPREIAYFKDSTRTFDKKTRLNISFSKAWREVWREDYKHHAFSTSIYASKGITKYNDLLLGIDGFWYDEESMFRAHASWAEDNPNVPADYQPDTNGKQLALTAGTEVYLGSMSVVIQGGFYLYKPQKIYDATWYQRYGLKYYPHQNIYAQVMLKSHSRTADMVEFGLGVKI